MVLSDGQPAGSHSDEHDLENAVESIMTQTDQKLVALGLGRGTEHVAHYYPTSLPNIDARQLPETMGNLLFDLITHPEKYRAGLEELKQRQTERKRGESYDDPDWTPDSER